MTIRTTALNGWWVLAVALAAGCHNGDSSDSNRNRISGGIPVPTSSPVPPPTPIVSYGTVTALGSVWVNGVHYDTSQAAIEIDHQTATEAELRVGDVVRVSGDKRFNGTRVATSVDVRSALHGPISSVDAAGGALVVLGQRVVADAGVVFESVPQRSLAGLAVGDLVEVAGLPGSDGKVFASRIAKKPLGPLGLRASGLATNVDAARLRFTLNGLVVDFRGAATASLAHGTVMDGDRVAVRGSSLSTNGELVATEIRPDDPLPTVDAAYRRIELEGVITAHDAAPSPAAFTLSGTRITTSRATRYVGPRSSSWLDAKAIVEGPVQPDGSVDASLVRFAHPAPVQLRARVDSVSAADGTFVALGITVRTEPLTRITDESAIHAQPFGLSNLAASDYVHVAGVESPRGSGVVVAALVERLDAEPETQLQGYPQLTPPYIFGQLAILGVTVTTTASTRYPTPTAGADLGAATFFFDLDFTSLIDVRGEEVADRTIVASEARYVDWPRDLP